MKLKTVAAATLVSLASFGAFAADLGDLAPSASFSRTVAAGLFEDSWSFNLATPSVVASSITNVEVTFAGLTFGGIENFAAMLNNEPLLPQSFVTYPSGATISTQVLSGSTALPAGTFMLTVSGIAGAGGASYGGNIVAAPVPEPETYALMLAGLGAIGFMASRRRKS